MKIGFIGCGNMGAALAAAASKAEGVKLYLADRDEAKCRELAGVLGATVTDNESVAREADIIFLAVKPNIIATVAEEIKSTVKGRRVTVVTMAAGVAISKLETILGAEQPIIRIMPNTPSLVGKGMILWCKNGAVSDEAESTFISALRAAGELMPIAEGQIDAASAISGCGPAFVYMFADALATGGVASGLTREVALKLAAETAIGACEMIKQTGKHPDKLRDEVCSPGGSTIEGVLALENGAFRSTVCDAVIASYEKTKRLGK